MYTYPRCSVAGDSGMVAQVPAVMMIGGGSVCFEWALGGCGWDSSLA